MAQELLTTFSTDIGELALVPALEVFFDIRIGDDTCAPQKGHPSRNHNPVAFCNVSS